MTSGRKELPAKSGTGAEVEAFVQKLRSAPVVRAGGSRGRLMFAMDATASREPTWDRACHIQAEMFNESAALGGLEIQLVFYRGFQECKASSWLASAPELLKRMTAVRCLGGQTQIERVLRHALNETRKQKIDALVFVGDAMEEDADRLCHLAGELGLLGAPCFVFHEGGNPLAASTFKQIARLSGGAYCRFDSSSARQLRELLTAVAVFVAGGRLALQDFSKRVGGDVLQLTSQLGKG